MTIPQVSVAHGTIGEADVDVLVNASNTQLRLGSGVSAAIRQSCGAGFQERLDRIVEEHGAIEPGDVIITDAHQHPRAKHVAHVAVMDYRPGASEPRPTLARVRLGCERLWPAVAALGPGTAIGMVALGAGTGGLGLRDSIAVACETLRACGDPRIARVVFCAYALHEAVNTLAVVRRHFAVDVAHLDPRIVELADADP